MIVLGGQSTAGRSEEQAERMKETVVFGSEKNYTRAS
jgi:hypothetical protein